MGFKSEVICVQEQLELNLLFLLMKKQNYYEIINTVLEKSLFWFVWFNFLSLQ